MTPSLAEAAVFLSRVPAISILLKATLVLVLGLAAARLARRERASVRHVLLAATFATLLALPLLVLVGPAVSIEVPIAAGPVAPAAASSMAPTPSGAAPTLIADRTSTVAAAGESHDLPWSRLALGAWLAGVALLTISLAVDLWRVRRVVRDGLPWIELRQRVRSAAAQAGVRRAVEVLRHEDVAGPFTAGLWRPCIVVPAAATAWSDAELDRAIVHELEHVRRNDWAVQIAARVACACYWCHPLVWVAWRRLRLEAERACDDAVVQQAEHTGYAAQLVSMAQRMSSARAQPVLGMANRSDLARRVAALLDATQRRGRAGARTVASASCAALLVGAAIAPVRAIGMTTGDVVDRPTATRTPGEESRRGMRRDPLDRALFEAASAGNVVAIARLLDAGANVDAVIPGDGSPLIGAARAGRLDAVRLLLDHGADPDMGVPGDGTALIVAAGEGDVDLVMLLLDRGASLDLVVPGDENALIRASGNGRLDVVRRLVSRGADVNARVWAPTAPEAGEWRTPLGMARRNGHTEVVELLLAAGAVE